MKSNEIFNLTIKIYEMEETVEFKENMEFNRENYENLNEYIKAYLNSEETKRKVLGTILKQIKFCKEKE